MFEHVIVPVDSWHPSDRAVPHALRLAEKTGAKVLYVAVVTDDAAAPIERAHEILDDLASRHPDIPAQREVRIGVSAAVELADTASGLSNPLLCLATQSTGGPRDLLLSSTATAVLHRSTIPTLLVGPAASVPRVEGPVILATDGSTHAESVVALAVQWRDAFGVDLHVVSVLDPSTSMPPDLLESGAAHRAAQHVGTATYTVLHDRHPSRALAAHADELGAGAIVMSTHGRTGLARITLGSVALRTGRRASCPVLVRRPGAFERP